MIAIVWEFHIRPTARDEFLRHYSAEGSWARLFRRSDGYLETELIEDREDSSRFLCVDRWRSCEAYQSFLNENRPAYDELDRQCEELTIREVRIGTFRNL